MSIRSNNPQNNEPASNVVSWFVVTVLSVASIVSYIDRQIINLLVEPIKADLGLTDVDMSLLQGISFALLYAGLAIPIAWVADRRNRKHLILFGIACWSIATFSAGLAMGFAMLFMARMFVGVGEATLAPAGVSIISDYFPKKGLPAAISVFTGSNFVGSGLALIVGGMLIAKLTAIGEVTLPFGTFQPWQMTFMILSLLSIPVFLLVSLIREPIRRDGNVLLASDDAPPAFEIISFLTSHWRAFAALIFGFSCFAAAQFGLNAWVPTYFIRVHGWSPAEVGQYFGPIVIVGGAAGVILGGMIADAALRRGIADATIRIPIFAALIAIPFAVAFPLLDSGFASLACLVPVVLFSVVPFGAGVSTFPLITPNRMRAQVMSAYLFIANLLGYSLGPVLIATLTDELFADPKAINLSLAVATPAIMALGLILLILSLGPYRKMRGLQSQSQSPDAAHDVSTEVSKA